MRVAFGNDQIGIGVAEAVKLLEHRAVDDLLARLLREARKIIGAEIRDLLFKAPYQNSEQEDSKNYRDMPAPQNEAAGAPSSSANQKNHPSYRIYER